MSSTVSALLGRTIISIIVPATFPLSNRSPQVPSMQSQIQLGSVVLCFRLHLVAGLERPYVPEAVLRTRKKPFARFRPPPRNHLASPMPLHGESNAETSQRDIRAIIGNIEALNPVRVRHSDDRAGAALCGALSQPR